MTNFQWFWNLYHLTKTLKLYYIFSIPSATFLTKCYYQKRICWHLNMSYLPNQGNKIRFHFFFQTINSIFGTTSSQASNEAIQPINILQFFNHPYVTKIRTSFVISPEYLSKKITKNQSHSLLRTHHLSYSHLFVWSQSFLLLDNFWLFKLIKHIYWVKCPLQVNCMSYCPNQ